MSTPTVPPILPPIGTPLPPAPISPLEPGDELSRDEFERRYTAMPGVKKAELIEGIVYMPSPVNLERHGEPEMDLGVWLGLYKISTPGVAGGHNSTVRLDLKNEPQPDLLLCVRPECGGRVRIIGGYIEGGPELVAEVASSSVSIDLKGKFRSYHRNEVQEYLVWRVDDQAVDWFRLQGSEYALIEPDARGWLRSVALPGLWLDPQALVRRDMNAVLAALQEGLADPSHREFVDTLAARRRNA
jgi:Uma2 family endonuclease